MLKSVYMLLLNILENCKFHVSQMGINMLAMAQVNFVIRVWASN